LGRINLHIYIEWFSLHTNKEKMATSADVLTLETVSPLKEEAKHWFALALPLAATLLCRTGMMLTDVSVLGLWGGGWREILICL
jgi:hypothetical protein